MQRHGHYLADARNLHLHRAALDKLRLDPARKDSCLRLVNSWMAQPDHPAGRWLEQWREMLSAWPIDRMAELVLHETNGQSLRQCSPLGPLLSPQERWKLLEEVNRALAAGAGSDS